LYDNIAAMLLKSANAKAAARPAAHKAAARRRTAIKKYPPPTEAELRSGIRCGPDCPMPHIPNKNTIAAMREMERGGKNVLRAKNGAEFRKHLKSAGLL
jgi:hypothetical protein